jgi:ABC-type uncharacterized transport system substrate-binding protein
MIARMLDGDGTANSVPVEKGQIINLSLNLAAAERMGVTIPQAVIDRAVITY